MADGTPKKSSITFGSEVCNINASEPGSATKADGALVRLPVFVVDDVLAGTGGAAARTTTAGTGDVPVVGNTPSGIAARVQSAAAKNSANAQNQALGELGTIDTDGAQAALAASQSDESSQENGDRELPDPEDKGCPPPSCLDGDVLLLDCNNRRKQIMGNEYEKFKDAALWSGPMAFKDIPVQWQQLILIIEKNHPRGTQERARLMINWMHSRATFDEDAVPSIIWPPAAITAILGPKGSGGILDISPDRRTVVVGMIINILENDHRMAKLITNQDEAKLKLPTAKYSSELLKNQHLIVVAVKQLDEYIFQRAAKLQLATAVQQATVTHPVQTRIPEVRFVNKWGATGEPVIFKTNENIVTWLEKFHGKVTDYFHPTRHYMELYEHMPEVARAFLDSERTNVKSSFAVYRGLPTDAARSAAYPDGAPDPDLTYVRACAILAYRYPISFETDDLLESFENLALLKKEQVMDYIIRFEVLVNNLKLANTPVDEHRAKRALFKGLKVSPDLETKISQELIGDRGRDRWTLKELTDRIQQHGRIFHDPKRHVQDNMIAGAYGNYRAKGSKGSKGNKSSKSKSQNKGKGGGKSKSKGGRGKDKWAQDSYSRYQKKRDGGQQDWHGADWKGPKYGSKASVGKNSLHDSFLYAGGTEEQWTERMALHKKHFVDNKPALVEHELLYAGDKIWWEDTDGKNGDHYAACVACQQLGHTFGSDCPQVQDGYISQNAQKRQKQ